MNEITYVFKTEFQGHDRGGMLADEHNKEMGALLTLSKCALLSGYQKKVKEFFSGLQFQQPLLQDSFDTKVLSMLSCGKDLT